MDGTDTPPAGALTERQQRHLALYRDLWAELNATRAFIAQLEQHARDIQARQRQLANRVAQEDAGEAELT